MKRMQSNMVETQIATPTDDGSEGGSYASHSAERQTVYPWMKWDGLWRGVSAKLTRAHHHFWDMDKEAWHYLRRNPIEWITAPAPDLGVNWFRITAHMSQESTEQISLLLGDMFNNLRAALDHTIGVVDPRAGRRASFPICTSQSNFQEWATKWRDAGGVEALIAPLEERQPYQAESEGRDPEHELLRIIARNNNTDKHRILLTTPIGFPDDPQRANLALSSDLDIAEYQWKLPIAPLTEPKYDAVHVRIQGQKEPKYVGMEGTIPLGISVERYDDVVGLSWKLLNNTIAICDYFRTDHSPA